MLTLALLADRAGVSKPIAYDHFVSRAGLLVAMMEDTSQYYETDAEDRLATAPQTIPAIADIVARAYVLCSLDAGPAVMTLAAAVEADFETRGVGRAFRQDHAAKFQRAFEPVVEAPPQTLTPLYKALIAAANSICDDLMRKELSSEDAIKTLSHLLVASLSPFAKS